MGAITDAAKRRRSERSWVYISRERKRKLQHDARILEEKYPDKYVRKLSMAQLATTLLGEAIDAFRP